MAHTHYPDRDGNEAKRPNILFFLTDQHNPNIAGFAGHDIVETPNLDLLAQEGMTFDNTYCQQPLCVPSRMSMLTGQYPKDLGIYDNRDILPANSDTFPRRLSSAGYRTCLIGKAHLNGDQFQGYQQRPYGDLFGQAHQPDPKRLPENYSHGLGDIPTQSGPSGIPEPLTQTEICVAESAKWLQEHVDHHASQPFLLSVQFDKPHFPINPPARFFEKYMSRTVLPDHWQHGHGQTHLNSLVPFVRENFLSEGYYDLDPELHRRTLAAYYGCVEWVDDAIGRILSVLDYLGLSDNTVVLYGSDHGEMASQHGAWQKMVFYEESARVPFIIRYPGVTKPNSHFKEMTGLIDVYPTMCDIAGTEPSPEARGVSLLPALDGTKKTIRDQIFSESVLINKPEHAGCMVRHDKWKFNYYLDGTRELYDLNADPDERSNLASDPAFAPVIQELEELVVDYWNPEQQRARYEATPRMPFEKHYYPYSNQFMGAAGSWFNGRP